MLDNNSGAVNKPNQFEGDKGKSKEFLDELYLYFAGNTKKIQTDKDKVQCTLSYIKGPAQFFVHTIITDAEEPISDSKDTPLKGLPSWANFRKSFIQTFRVEDDTQVALNEISKRTWASRLNKLGQIRELQCLIPPALLIKIATQPPLPVTVEKDKTKDSSNEEGIAEEYIQAISSEKDF
ncbi:uncharacterized protein FIBRA_09560 [Fibroporia radiculosa]|uniref:Uncharacterized protein n=1 Tax=Fibroporia radiculosa TaxID=599839 RepID=J7RWB2_9APHY|nr:uncharacterized protein FIBRA_09560 [Fibroporia radiculosa]CCM07215.1 predicted protein [Fibroporia radiculosa]